MKFMETQIISPNSWFNKKTCHHNYISKWPPIEKSKTNNFMYTFLEKKKKKMETSNVKFVDPSIFKWLKIEAFAWLDRKQVARNLLVHPSLESR